MGSGISLDGRVALITGGGRGIGKAIARRYCEAGARVVLASRKAEVLEATAAELAGLGGEVLAVPCHVGRAEQLQALVERTEQAFGPVDVLVNNAVTNVGSGPALELTDAAFDKMVEVNVKAALRLVRLTVPAMIERGRGSVINLASVSGLTPQPDAIAYSFTKAGLLMLTRCWAREFGRHGVRVNAIAPGLVQTDFSEYLWRDEERRAHFTAAQAIDALAQPEDIGFAALWLASDEARMVTGQTLVIDGGMTV